MYKNIIIAILSVFLVGVVSTAKAETAKEYDLLVFQQSVNLTKIVEKQRVGTATLGDDYIVFNLKTLKAAGVHNVKLEGPEYKFEGGEIRFFDDERLAGHIVEFGKGKTAMTRKQAKASKKRGRHLSRERDLQHTFILTPRD